MQKEIIKDWLLKNGNENLINLLSTAFYGSEWFSARYFPHFNNLIRPESECREEKWADILSKGGSIVVVDWEDEESEHDITLEKIIDAVCQVSVRYPKVYGNVMSGEDDFYDADCMIQHAVYGEWVYG